MKAWLLALSATTLLAGGCAILGGHGSGIASPFFDGTKTRSTGTVLGYVGAALEPGDDGFWPIVVSPHPLDPVRYRAADGIRIALSTGAVQVTDARGIYYFGSVGRGEHELVATDPTGAYDDTRASIEVRPGAITPGLEPPVDPPEAPSAPYLPVGPDDFLRLQSVRGPRIWQRTDTPDYGTFGAYRMSLTAAGWGADREYLDLAFTSAGVVLAGTEAGTLNPPATLLAPDMRLNDAFSTPTTLRDPAGVTEDAGSVVSRLEGVDDLVLAAGRFDNCPRVNIALTFAGATKARTMWLAWRVGPVKMVIAGIDHQADYGVIGGVQYR